MGATCLALVTGLSLTSGMGAAAAAPTVRSQPAARPASGPVGPLGTGPSGLMAGSVVPTLRVEAGVVALEPRAKARSRLAVLLAQEGSGKPVPAPSRP